MFFTPSVGFTSKFISPWNFAYLTNAANTADGTTFTFSSQNLGVSAKDRYIIVGASAWAVAAVTITGVTVAGITATSVISANNGSSTYNTGVSIRAAAVPAAVTTGSIVVTTSTTSLRAAIGVWRMVGGDPLATSTASDIVLASDALSGTLIIPTGGAGIGYAAGFSSAGSQRTASWTNLTKNFDVSPEADGFNEPSHTGATSSTAGSLTRTVTYSGGMQANCPLVLAAFQPMT